MDDSCLLSFICHLSLLDVACFLWFSSSIFRNSLCRLFSLDHFFSFAMRVMLKSVCFYLFSCSCFLCWPTKQVLIYSCISFLLISDLPPPATRDRPPGCKTVFVGGLPENATEQLIMEVFGQCGDITALRKSKKNFCHIRFAEEVTVDKALFLSGEQSYFFTLL